LLPPEFWRPGRKGEEGWFGFASPRYFAPRALTRRQGVRHDQWSTDDEAGEIDALFSQRKSRNSCIISCHILYCVVQFVVVFYRVISEIGTFFGAVSSKNDIVDFLKSFRVPMLPQNPA